MKSRFPFLALLFSIFFPLGAQAQMKYVEGHDYETLATPIEQADKQKVIEFFWFACPHCSAMRPAVQKWVMTEKSADVIFEYVPAVIGSDSWDRPAQAYYTMKRLEVDLFDAYFDALHKDRQYGLMASDAVVRDFFVSHGVDPQAFDKAWNSFQVQQKLERARRLFKASGLDGVPAFVVNGKYVVEAEAGYARMLDVVENLLEK